MLLFAALFFAACTEQQDPVQRYGTSLTDSYAKAKALDKSVNMQQVQNAIHQFYAANGRYPNDLDEASSASGLSLKSGNYEYSPATGILKEISTSP